MRKLTTRKYDIAERLKTPEEMALYLDACIAEGDAALIAKALGDIARAKGMTRSRGTPGCHARACIKRCPGSAPPTSAPFSRSCARLACACMPPLPERCMAAQL